MRVASRVVGVVLVLAGVGFVALPAKMDLDWQTVPERLRTVLGTTVKASGVAFLILGMLSAWNQWSHHQASSRIVDSAFLPLLFAWEGLFFAYGELVTDPRAPPPARL
ncbi:MAG: hypothetical protein ABSH31_12790 [Bryobacteraceae bacterium]